MGDGLRRTDMLNGNLFSGILMFAIPLAASSILQQLFNSVDVAVVGHFAQNRAVATAAVGSNGSVINLIINRLNIRHVLPYKTRPIERQDAAFYNVKRRILQ